MKSSILLSLLTAGFLAAQTTPPPQAPPPQAMHSHHRIAKGARMARLTRQLNLTPDQQKQARSIFADARAQRQQVHATTMAKFSSILSPDQKAKFDAMKAKRAKTS